jgi:hypothetical protein
VSSHESESDSHDPGIKIDTYSLHACGKPVMSVNVREASAPCKALAAELDEKLLPESMSVPGSFNRSHETMTSRAKDRGGSGKLNSGDKWIPCSNRA